MSTIRKQDTEGTKPLLNTGELGFDNYPVGGDAGRVYVGTGATNIPLARKDELPAVATTEVAGLVEKAITAEAIAGTADKFPDAAGVKAHVDSRATSGPTDSTIGKLLKVGDGGLITSISLTDEDLNAILYSGFYRLNNNHANAPYGLGSYGQLIVSRGQDTVTQVWFEYGSPEMYIRSGNPPEVGGAGVWNPWTRVLTTANTGSVVNEDYEEGFWVPSLGGTVLNPAVVFNSARGTYIKVGNHVTASFFLDIASVTVQGSGLLTTQLPFVGNDEWTGALSLYQATPDTVGAPILKTVGGSSAVALLGMANGRNVTFSDASNIQNGYLIGAITFQTV